MGTPFAWRLLPQASLLVLCACCAPCAAPAAALGSPERDTSLVYAPTVAAADSISKDEENRTSQEALERRAMTLLAIGGLVGAACLIGMIAGGSNRGPPAPRVRLLNKPKKTQLSVLVPPGPAPRLIPSESPNAIRARPARAPVSRQTPEGDTRSGIVHYIAAFTNSGQATEEVRVDYLLEPGEGAEQSADPLDEVDGPLRQSE